MMKNTEWGAVAYLSHSKYGIQDSVRINNNSAYLTGYAAVKEPSCGYTGDNRDCNVYENTLPMVDGSYTLNYKNPFSVVASTTGNYSGIYDMSGGSWEYVMGVIMSKDNIPCSGRDATYNSGFNGPYCYTTGNLTTGIADFPRDTKYYDIYAYGTVYGEYNRRILGDATGEMGPFSSEIYGLQTRQIGSWYKDEALFVWSGDPWFYRGYVCGYGLGAGMFSFHGAYGSLSASISYRIVLAF